MARRAQSSDRRRPHRLPPPITHGGEALEALAVLQEIPGNAGLMLWKTIRSVGLWAALDQKEREEAFEPGAYADRIRDLFAVQLDVALVEPAVVAAGVLKGSADAAAVAAACRSMAGWAERAGKVRTALAATQAAALTYPQVAEHAFEVGRLARVAGEHGRAESWLRHSIATSRRQRDSHHFCRAYLGLGNLLLQRGNLPTATKCMTRAARAAKRHSLRELQALAHHGLVEVAIHAGRDREVLLHARLAQSLYPAEHPRHTALAHDVAFYWMTRGHFDAALRVFKALGAGMDAPGERLCLAGSLGRAAGAVGDSSAFDEALRSARELVRDVAAANYAAGSLLDLARGALALGSRDLAETLAAEAARIAESRAEGEIRMLTETLLQEIAGGAADADNSDAVRTKTPRRIEVLADQFARTLAAAG